MHNLGFGMRLTSSWNCTVPNRDSRSTERLCCDTGSTSRHVSSRQGTINLRLGAVRHGVRGLDCGLLSANLAAGIRRLNGVKNIAVRLGNGSYRIRALALVRIQAPSR